ncbi:MAG: ABC transporter permease, partial [Candidatus Hydrogenedentes bacterium]|nr:ABC transporter permease [Candidatus Hydrogenedentota bacterium]
FMVETLFLCTLDIALGVLVAVVLAVFTEYAQRTVIIPSLMKFKAYWGTSGAGGKSMDPRGWNISYGLVVITSLITAAVTLGAALAASLLPAREASRMHVVECLRRHWEIPAKARRSRWARSPWLRPILDDPERTWLAVSTLMVGVALIVVLTAVGEYNRLESSHWLRAVSSDTIDFHIWQGVTMPFERYPLFDQAFINEVKKCPHVKDVFYAFSFTRAFYIKGGRFTLRSPAITADEDFMERHRLWGVDALSGGLLTFYQNLEMLEGEDLTADDIAAARPVCVLDEYTAKCMYPDGNPVGQPFAVDGQTFTVKGIIKEPKTYGGEQWSGAYIPLPFSRTVMNNETTQGLSARVSDAYLARDEIAELYETRYGVELERSKQFTMVGEAQAQKRREAWFNAALLVSLAAGAMFVGGIGMMNIMLISMTARTREIGTLRALGATRAAIVGEFLFESAVLSVLGGLIGIAAGIVATTYGMPILYQIWGQDEAWQTQLSLHWAGVALAFALLVGVAATLGPAIKASFIAPVEALRDA